MNAPAATTTGTLLTLLALVIPTPTAAQASLQASPARVEMEAGAQVDITVQGRNLDRYREAEIVDTGGRRAQSFTVRLGRLSRAGLPIQLSTAGARPGRYALRLNDGRAWVTVAIEIEVPALPAPPTARGRLEPIEYGSPVLLDATGSAAAPGRSVATYHWTGNIFEMGEVTTTDETVTVAPANAATPGRYDVQLTVVDDLGVQSEPVQVELRVQDTQSPTAVVQAPPDVVDATAFDLDASASTDPNGGTIVQYHWTLVAVDGPSNVDMIVNQQITTDEPSWTVRSQDGARLAPAVLTFQVEVVDWAGNRSATNTVEVPVEATTPPTAVGAIDPIEFGDPVVLNATGSSAAPDRTVTEYRWTGNIFEMGEVTTADETVTVAPAGTLAPGRYDVLLTVVDDLGLQSQPVQVELRVQDTRRPTAVAQVETLVILRLDATASADAEPGTVSSYRWVRLSGGGGAWPVNQTIQTDDPVLVIRGDQGDPLSPGTHAFSLTVVDDSGNTSTPTTITVEVPQN